MNKNEQQIDLKEIFFLLLSKIRFIILLTILGGAVAFAYAKICLPVMYTSSVSIYVMANTNTETTDANQANIVTARSLASTYIVVLEDDIVYEQVSDKLLEDYAPADLQNYFTVQKTDDGYSIPASQIKGMVSYESVDSTEVIKITATTESAQISADICTYITEIAPDLLTTVTHAGSVEAIGTAKVPSAPSSPNVNKITLMGALLGFVIAVAIIVIINLLDNCISSADEVRQRYSIPVLAEIPDLEMNEKEAAKYEY